MEKMPTPTYETPTLTTYGDLKTLTKGTLAGSGDSTSAFKPA